MSEEFRSISSNSHIVQKRLQTEFSDSELPISLFMFPSSVEQHA